MEPDVSAVDPVMPVLASRSGQSQQVVSGNPQQQQQPRRHQWLHMYGVCEARRGVLPSSAPAAYCGQVNRGTPARHNHCHSLRQVLTAILFNHMRTSQTSVCGLSWREGWALVAA
ncbi:hypothetical protein FQA47_024926 [Oryzias melastigma]|uniref:Uncharacterized protein n=1 Tax=Oryzias melastigma TaxID=30732 RepID=A0A834C070_ORYME|nr:hypothetical protein FQA47_024926 [Oryzias melastigma]